MDVIYIFLIFSFLLFIVGVLTDNLPGKYRNRL